MRGLALLLGIGCLHAATTTTWEMSSYQDFVKGRFHGVALEQDGRLTLAPKLDTVFASGQPAIWSVAQAPDGSLYLGTGHRGRVYKITRAGAASLIWSADQPEVFTVAVDSAGALYAATSPDGKVVRIENGKATDVFAPKAKYIWALAPAKDGSVYVATGQPGNVYRIDRAGNAELYYETGQSHVTALALDAHGDLLAGSEPNGLLYRINGKDKAFVLYNTNLPEIRSIVPMPDGSIYAAALGGSLANRMGQLTTMPTSIGSITVTAPPTSITVTDSAQASPEVKPKPDTTKPAVQSTIQTATPTGAIAEIAGVDKSALYRIGPDNTVETLWTSKDENVYDMVVKANGSIVFGTDSQGRIYQLTTDHKTALLAQTGEGEATRLIQSQSGLLATTGDVGKLLRLEDASGATGEYEAPVHDAGTVARWGRITWHGAGPLKFQTRTGNSARADKTWSDWSAPLSDPQNSLIPSPNARYIQWRAQFSGTAPRVDNVVVAYLPQNSTPVIHSINVTTQAAGSAKSTTQGSSSTTAAYSITVTDTGETSSTAGSPTQTVGRAGGAQIQIVWQADDPDNDRLVYTLSFRGEDEAQWKMLRINMPENSLVLDSDILADGRYYFRVVASDRASNPIEYARQAELVSAPVLIDNTPPVVSIGPPTRVNDRLEIMVEAMDQTSPLKRCEYSIDAGQWTPVEAADGVTDSPHEQFKIGIDRLRAGEHLLVVRVYDTANNPGLAKLVIR